jgi:hypothetical protein
MGTVIPLEAIMGAAEDESGICAQATGAAARIRAVTASVRRFIGFSIMN